MPRRRKSHERLRSNAGGPQVKAAMCGTGERKPIPKKSSGILCEGNRVMAYRFLEEHHKEFGLRWLLRRMGICPNAYYNYLKHEKADYHARKEAVCREILDIYHEYEGVLGHRSIRVFLDRKGIHLSKTTVHKYMNKELKLYSVCRRHRPGYKKGSPHRVFPNLLNQNFSIDQQNKVWCTDFTYLFLTNEQVRFNCTILDLYDRSVVARRTGKWDYQRPCDPDIRKGSPGSETSTGGPYPSFRPGSAIYIYAIHPILQGTRHHPEHEQSRLPLRQCTNGAIL